MNKIKIFLVEEKENEIENIERTINEWTPNGYMVEYHQIDIDLYKNENSIAADLFDEIETGNCDLIIIDYSLAKRNKNMNGNIIFDCIFSKIQYFPIVMLTNRPDECRNQQQVDANKIYFKGDFFLADEDCSKNMVYNLFANVFSYRKKLNEARELEKEIEDDANNDLSKILDCSEKISKVLPNSTFSRLKNIFNKEFFKETSKAINNAIDYLREHENNK